MSWTPLCPQEPAFRLKPVGGNRQEDVTKVEELADKRLLAALVASLDTEICLTYLEFGSSVPYFRFSVWVSGLALLLLHYYWHFFLKSPGFWFPCIY